MRHCPHCSRLFDDVVAVCPHDGTFLGKPDPVLGRLVGGRYRVDGFLGAGGMGAVYRATQLQLNRPVAIKTIRSSISAELLERFRREALVIARLKHPNIISIYDFGFESDIGTYIVMELVEGRSLGSEIGRRGRIPVPEALEVMGQLCAAVQEAHASGVVHRDLKPLNVMLEATRDGLRVKVLDFGIAKLWSPEDGGAPTLTQPGTVMGTPTYMAPEQCAGDPVDARADVYSLGVILYEMLTGSAPFRDANVLGLLTRKATQLPEPPSTLNPDLPEYLDGVVMTALAIHPEERYPSAAALARSLTGPGARRRDRGAASEGADADADTDSATGPRTLKLGSGRIAVDTMPLAGRTQELEEIRDHLDRACAGECQLVLISGEEGIGKSRLLAELEREAGARGVPVLHGRFAGADQAFSYSGYFELLNEYFRAGPDVGPGFEDLAPDLLALFPALSEISAFRSAAGEPAAPDRRFADQTAVFETLAAAVARMAGGRPLVLCLEDLHLADVSIGALQYLVGRLVPLPLLVACTHSSSEAGPGHPIGKLISAFRGDRRFAAISLGPLGPAEHAELVGALLGGEIDAELGRRLHEATEGNPYFTKELVRSLVDAQTIVRGPDGTWALPKGVVQLGRELPATIHEMVAQRIARLSSEAREVLTAAAVLGRQFEYRDLEAVVGERRDLEAVADALTDSGFLAEVPRSKQDCLQFTSAVVREALYAGLPRRKRRSLHRRFAEALEARERGRHERVLPQLVHHYAEADVGEKVVEFGMALARTSLAARSPDEAIRALNSVLEYVAEGEDRESEAEARTELGTAHRMGGNNSDALNEFELAVGALELAGRTERAAMVMAEAAEAAWEGRQLERARSWVERGLGAPGTTGQQRRLLSLGAMIANLRGEHEQATDYLTRADTLEPDSDADESTPRGGRLVVAIDRQLTAGRPAEARTTADAEVLGCAFETLVRSDERGAVTPWLCTRWEAIDNARSFLFTIRDGVTLHDGRPLTSAEVAASIVSAIRHAGTPLPPAFAAIRGAAGYASGASDAVDGLETPSEGQIAFHLVEPLPIFPSLLTDLATAVACEPGEAGGALPAGTGPFVPRSLDARGALLDRWEGSWRATAARLDTLEFRVVERAAERLRGVRQGEIDVAGAIDADELDGVLRQRGQRVGVLEAPTKGICFVLLNRAGRLGGHPHLCTALTGSIRTHDVVRSTLGRFAQPAEGLLSPGILGHDAGRRRQPLPSAAAAEAVRSSGLELPVTLRAAVDPDFRARNEALLDALFRDWSELGVEVSIVTDTPASYLASLTNPDGIDLAVVTWRPDYGDPDGVTHSLFHSQSGVVRAYYASEAMDRLLEEARAESRPAAREALYRRIDEQLAETGLLAPLYYTVDYRVVGAHVRGARMSSAPPFVNYAELGKAEAVTPSTRRSAARPLEIWFNWALPRSLDPCPAVASPDVQACLTVFETLLRSGEGARVVPWLASWYRVEEHGRRFRFGLRENVRFHDGRGLTARDVRHSFERLLKSGSQNASILGPVVGAKAVMEGTVSELAGFRVVSASEFVVELERPLAIFPALLTWWPTAIVPEDTGPLDGPSRGQYVGTGPYRVARFEAGRPIELEAHPGYWRRGYPRSSALVLTFEKREPADVIATIREGRFAMAANLSRSVLTSSDKTTRRDVGSGNRICVARKLSTFSIACNVHRGPLADEAQRRRLQEILDADTLCRRIGTLGIVPATSFHPPEFFGAERRREALPRGDTTAVPLDLSCAVVNRESALAAAVLDLLAMNGIAARVVNRTYEEYTEAVRAGEVDFVLTGWSCDYPDPDAMAFGVLHSEGGRVGKIVGTPELDRLCERGREETDPDLRRAIYDEIEDYLARHAVILPIYHGGELFVVRSDVKGLEFNLFAPFFSVEKLHLASSETP